MLKRLLVIALALLVAGSAGCRRQADSDAPHPRIVSFSPALTAILFDMGLGEHVVGVTRYCRLPEGVERTLVGDQFTINTEAVLAARPDLILTQSDLSRFEGVKDAAPDVQIVRLVIEELDEIPTAVRRIGQLTGKETLAKRAVEQFIDDLEHVRQSVEGKERPRVLFVMGTDRPSTAGENSFIDDMIELAGGTNAGADIPGNTVWRRTHIDAIAKVAPDVIICQVFGDQLAAQARQYWLKWSDLPASRAGRVYVVDEPEWTIPSTHLAELTARLAEMIHPPEDEATVEMSDSTQSASRQASVSLRRAWLLRWLAAGIVGAGLAVGGMALQGLLRNPLAEPYLLGVSSGAGVGVLLGLAATAWWSSPLWASTPLLAFAGAVLTCTVVYAVAQRQGRLDPYSLILSGVIVNTFNGAIMLVIYLYIDPHRIADFAHWAMGRLPDSVDIDLLAICGGFVVLGWVILLVKAPAMNVLSLGDQVAASSGVSVNRLRMTTFVCVGLMTAAAVALAGPVGFLGLIVPHICRMIFGPDQRVGMIASGVVGAVLLMAAESLCRFAGPYIGVSLIPVGILTAISGGPFFIVLLRRQRGRAEV